MEYHVATASTFQKSLCFSYVYIRAIFYRRTLSTLARPCAPWRCRQTCLLVRQQILNKKFPGTFIRKIWFPLCLIARESIPDFRRNDAIPREQRNRFFYSSAVLYKTGYDATCASVSQAESQSSDTYSTIPVGRSIASSKKTASSLPYLPQPPKILSFEAPVGPLLLCCRL